MARLSFAGVCGVAGIMVNRALAETGEGADCTVDGEPSLVLPGPHVGLEECAVGQADGGQDARGVGTGVDADGRR